MKIIQAILLSTLFLLASMPIASQEVVTARRRAGGGAAGTWSLIQFKYWDNVGGGTGGGTCSGGGSSCQVTITAPTAGNLLVAVGFFDKSTSTMTTPTGGQTWTHCAGTNGCLFGNNTVGLIDAWYVTSATSTGQTSVTCNYSGGTTAYQSCGVYEYHWTGTTISFDTSNGAIDATCTTCAGATLTLGGTADVIIQTGWSLPSSTGFSAITGSYTSPKQFYSGGGDAGWINTSSGAAPNWTGSSAQYTVMGIAFKGT